jgi:hypothetical protein
MHEKKSHEQYVEAARLKVVETAQAMLDGQMSYLLGARRLDSLRHDVSVRDDDADFIVFVAIASDTDDYPLGPVCELWDKRALARLQPEIEAAERWAKEQSMSTCETRSTFCLEPIQDVSLNGQNPSFADTRVFRLLLRK